MNGDWTSSASLTMGLVCEGDGMLRGFAFDPEALAMRFVIEVLADGLPIALVRAHDYRVDLSVGDGCYGFSVKLAGAVIAHGPFIEARLANTNVLVGTLMLPDGVDDDLRRPKGGVEWAGGLKLTGWLSDDTAAASVVVKALVDGREVARTTARSWRHREEGGEHCAVRAFDLRLPADLAKGRVVTVDVLSDAGFELSGSPCLVFALADGFAGVIDAHAEIESERPRARFADGLLPQSLPLDHLAAWQERFPAAAPEPRPDAHVHVLIVGESGAEATLASLVEPSTITWSASIVASSDSPVSFAPRHLRAIAAEVGTDCDLIVATLSGTRLVAGALGHFVVAAQHFPEADAFYADIVVSEGDAPVPSGFPAYDDERFLEQGYCSYCFAVRPKSLSLAANADCVSLFELFPAPDSGEDRRPSASPVHLPMILAALPHVDTRQLGAVLLQATRRRLSRRGVPADVDIVDTCGSPSVRVRRRRPNADLSILIPARTSGSGLRNTLDALTSSAAAGRTEIIIADGGCSDPIVRSTLDAARRDGISVLSAGITSNEALLFNCASAKAHGATLLCLKPGVVPNDADWLNELWSRLQDQRIGAVGPLVAWPHGVIRHAGLVLGPKYGAVTRFRDHRLGDAGPDHLLRVAHQVSAMTAECLMVRRSLFQHYGGFDEIRFGTNFYDIDFCLRLWDRGYRTIMTPHVAVTQTSKSPLQGSEAELGPVALREAATLRARWRLAPGCDPFYSPWMTMDDTPYSGLAWPPLPVRPRQPCPSITRAPDE